MGGLLSFCFANRCVCLEDKERWTPQQLLQHSFINIPRMKIPVAEENLDGEKLFYLCILLNNWTTSAVREELNCARSSQDHVSANALQ